MTLTEAERYALIEAIENSDFVSGFQKYLDQEAELFDNDAKATLRSDSPDLLKAVRSNARADNFRRAFISELKGFVRNQ